MYVVECATYERKTNFLYIFPPYSCDSLREAHNFMRDEFDEEALNVDVIHRACGNTNAKVETEYTITTWAIYAVN